MLGLIASIKFWAVIAYRMLRIWTVLLMSAFSAIGYELVQPTTHVSFKFVLVVVMIAALYSCGTCFNDAADEAIDKVNLPNDVSRPLVTTNITARQLRRLGVAELGVALLVAVVINPLYVLLVISWAVLAISYSAKPLRISYRGIHASILLSVNYVVLPFLAGVFIVPHAKLGRLAIEILAGLYCCFVGRILLKDFRDYVGDKKFGKLNFLVRHGPQLTCSVSAGAWATGCLILSLSLLRQLPIVVVIVQPLLVIVLMELISLSHQTQRTKQIHTVAIIGKSGNAIILAVLARITLEASRMPRLEVNVLTLAIASFTVLSMVNLHRPLVTQSVTQR